MAQLSDFQDEETLMQGHDRCTGVKVDRMPKCHHEMESSMIGRQQKGSVVACHFLKRDRKQFREAASRCLGSDQVLATQRQRMFSRQAREHMVACHTMKMSAESWVRKRMSGTQEIHS